METRPNFILPLSDSSAGLLQVGGKGASLAQLAAAGLPVPPGFTITTAAYRRFVTLYGLQVEILAAVSAAAPDQPAALKEASRRIEQLFAQAAVPIDIAGEIRRAYAVLGEGEVPVAVRSSATAEDLPEMSFAGQQETYLNIRGAEAVLEAVRKCWASLWTARAIAYRARQGIDPASVALAVVVQKLVFADAAGVMFTANPITGRRGEIVINAAWGLGEAVVSGAVTPDTLVVDKETGRIISRETAEKKVMTVRTQTGTREVPVPESRQKKAVLTGAQAVELAKLGAAIEELYGMPMDVEWALAAGKFAVLQARPITALPEPPLEWKSPYPDPLLAHADTVDLVPDAVSPLFATLGLPIANQVYLKMYARVMGLGGEDVPIFLVLNSYIYLCFTRRSRFWKYMSRHMTTVGKLYAYGLERADELRTTGSAVVDRWRKVDLASVQAPDLLAGVRELFEIAAGSLCAAICRPIPRSNFSELFFSRFYNALIKRKTDPAAPAFLLGLESLPLRAEKSLFDLAEWAKTQPELAGFLARTPADEIWTGLRSDPVPEPLAGAFAARFTAHLESYGHILYDLDFRNPVPAEEPAPLLDALKVYLAGQGSSPHSRQQAQKSKRVQAEQAISRRTGPLRRMWFEKLLRSAQECASERENAIANIGLPYPQLRRLLCELGQRLSAGGAILDPADICWLEAQEVDSLAASLEKKEQLASHAASVKTRRAAWKRARKEVPPVVMPENSFLARLAAPKKQPRTGLLTGFGVSPGRVTARACVLRGPEDFGQMRPGDVIVAVITTPAWTPLFAMASAVVADIGGPLSHGSIVAREYGIPAVMATGDATRRLITGQVITVDGGAGTVTLNP